MGRLISHMEVATELTCPWCGQSCQVLIDTSISEQRLTLDCQVCCRPFQVTAESVPGEILGLEVGEG